MTTITKKSDINLNDHYKVQFAELKQNDTLKWSITDIFIESTSTGFSINFSSSGIPQLFSVTDQTSEFGTAATDFWKIRNISYNNPIDLTIEDEKIRGLYKQMQTNLFMKSILFVYSLINLTITLLPANVGITALSMVTTAVCVKLFTYFSNEYEKARLDFYDRLISMVFFAKKRTEQKITNHVADFNEFISPRTFRKPEYLNN